MAGRLKPLDLEREKRPGEYADGGGLYLIVTGPNAKNWSFRYWFRDKERYHGGRPLRQDRLPARDRGSRSIDDR